ATRPTGIYTLSLHDALPICSETFLLDTLRYKGAGCITATGNVNAVAINRLYDTWQTESAEKQQERLNEVRSWFQQFPMIAAMKSDRKSTRLNPVTFRSRMPS